MCPNLRQRYSDSPAGVSSDAGGCGEPESAQEFPDEHELATRFRQRILVFAARRFTDAAAAEDVAQETLRRVIVALREGRIREPGALARYVLETARHVCLRGRRKAGRRRRALARLGGSDGVVKPDPLRAVVAEEHRQRVRRALERLRARDRALLRMLYYEELPFDEAAGRLGITRGALRVRKHRALRRLGDALEEDT